MSNATLALDFISSLKKFKTFYKSPSFSAGLLRLLDQNINSAIFTLLGTNLSVKTLKSRILKKDSSSSVRDIINKLISLNLIEKNNNRVCLNKDFRESFLESLVSEEDLRTRFYKVKDIFEDVAQHKNLCDLKFKKILEMISARKTEGYLIDKNNEEYIYNILVFSNLIDPSGHITNQGFEFLLKSKKEQLWFLIINIIKYLKDENLVFLMMELILGNNYDFYHTEINEFILFLNSIGVINIFKKKDKNVIFVNIFDLFSMEEGNLTQKYLVLETNFKIYAYTTSSFEISILSLFCKTVYSFPNMIKAYLSEESVISAFRMGITPSQIIKYLTDYSISVPPNMRNQIIIWGNKLNRIKNSNGYMYHDFLHLSDYKKVLGFIEDLDGLIFKDDEKRILIAREEFHDDIRVFIKSLVN